MEDKKGLSRKELIEIFLAIFTMHSYDQAIDGIKKLLEKGSPGRKKEPNKVTLNEWYLTLDDESKKHINEIIVMTAYSSTFSSLVVLDNKTTGYPVAGQPSDFALYLQTYENQNDMFSYSPKTSNRINWSYTIDGDLHDCFANLIQERSNAEKD